MIRKRGNQETSNLVIVVMRFKMHRYLIFALCGVFGITTSISAVELQEVASFRINTQQESPFRSPGGFSWIFQTGRASTQFRWQNLSTETEAISK
jgi:hypothetical protein